MRMLDKATDYNYPWLSKCQQQTVSPTGKKRRQSISSHCLKRYVSIVLTKPVLNTKNTQKEDTN